MAESVPAQFLLTDPLCPLDVLFDCRKKFSKADARGEILIFHFSLFKSGLAISHTLPQIRHKALQLNPARFKKGQRLIKICLYSFVGMLLV